MTASAPPAKAAPASAPLPAARVGCRARRPSGRWPRPRPRAGRRGEPRASRAPDRPARSPAVAARDEPGGIDVREADEAHPQPQPSDHSRPGRRGQPAAGSDAGHAEPLHPPQRVEQGRGAEVADCGCWRGSARPCPRRRRPASGRAGLPRKLYCLFGTLLPRVETAHSRFPKAMSAPRSSRRTPLQGNRVPLTAHHVGDAIAEVDVADGVEGDRPQSVTRIDRDGAAPGATARNR